MPSFLLSRKTPQKAASVPCSKSTRRSSPERPAVIARRWASVGGVRSNVVIWHGILTHSILKLLKLFPPLVARGGGRPAGRRCLGRPSSLGRGGRHGGRLGRHDLF